MGIGLFGTVHCVPGKRAEVFSKISKASEIALHEPEPLTLLLCLPLNRGQPGSAASAEQNDVIYLFERFASAESRKSGTQKSTPAFYTLVSEMLAADPPLLLKKPDVEMMPERFVGFREDLGDLPAVGGGRIYVRFVRRAVEGGGTGNSDVVDGVVEKIGASVTGTKGYLFGGAWASESEVWMLDCWDSEWGSGTVADSEAGKAFALVVEKGYVRKRVEVDASDGTRKFLHDVQISQQSS